MLCRFAISHSIYHKKVHVKINIFIYVYLYELYIYFYEFMKHKKVLCQFKNVENAEIFIVLYEKFMMRKVYALERTTFDAKIAYLCVHLNLYL